MNLGNGNLLAVSHIVIIVAFIAVVAYAIVRAIRSKKRV